jgi:hypothetical protein
MNVVMNLRDPEKTRDFLSNNYQLFMKDFSIP